jgi:predicted ATPase/DNA-binding SARP family transcriptional activator
MTTSEAAPAALTITLFGPMQVLVEGHPLPRLRSRKALSLLALLTLRHGRSVEREWLAGMLWPDSDQDQAAASLRPVLSELRRALGSEAARLQSPSRHSLRLELAEADVDVVAFDAAIITKQPSALARAVGLYRGPLLEDSVEEWVGQERTAREQDCLKALETLAEAALATGDIAAAIGCSRRAVALAPWRDAARRSLMEALARGGDANAALQVYREFVQVLRSDPKAAPDAQTSALYTRLRAEARQQTVSALAMVGVAAHAGSETAIPAVTGSLPHPLTGLIGREDERLEVAAKLRRSRLVTLTGPGGIGKTRLALTVAAEVVREFPDGVWLVPLETLSDGRLVALQIAGVLGVREDPGRPLVESLTGHLRAKRLLLVLDNCEHVLQASAEIVGHLQRECAWVRVLATSREALGVMGEMVWAVPSLAVPDPEHLPAGRTTLLRVLEGYEGVRLFIERAQSVQKDFTLTADNAPAVVQVCACLGGLPLAIELAAARVRAMTVAQLASRLDDYLGLLTGGSRTASPRHRTLRTTLDWSYALLSMQEQILLRRLSVFAGGWDLGAAEQVCAGEGIESGRVLDLLTSLVDKSLVGFDGEADGRYRLLEMVRQYASERLGNSAETERVRGRHREWFLALAEEAEPHLRGMNQGIWLRRLQRDEDNFRTALAWLGRDTSGAQPSADGETALRLVGALGRFWYVQGRFSEGLASLEPLRAQPQFAGKAERAKVLNGIGLLRHGLGSHAEARNAFEDCLKIRRELGDRRGTAESLIGLGAIDHHQGDYAAARKQYDESLNLSKESGDRFGAALALTNLSIVSEMQGDYASARSMSQEGLGIFRELKADRNVAWTLRSLGGQARAQGNAVSARAYFEESMDIFQKLGDRVNVAHLLNNLGNLAYDQGDFTSADEAYQEGLAVFREIGTRSRSRGR